MPRYRASGGSGVSKIPIVVALAGLAVATPGVAATPLAWGGEGCAAAADLRAAVDAAFEVAPFGEGRGSSAAGFSVAVQHDDCGRFAYAVGWRNVERRLRNQISTRQHIGSMTKPVTTALTLHLADEGLLGPRGIDSKVAPFFNKAERRQLTRGSGKDRLCPVTIQAIDRESGAFERVRAKCPKLKKITVRQLLNGNQLARP